MTSRSSARAQRKDKYSKDSNVPSKNDSESNKIENLKDDFNLENNPIETAINPQVEVKDVKLIRNNEIINAKMASTKFENNFVNNNTLFKENVSQK